jgi:AcrR family transcriptional regulator
VPTNIIPASELLLETDLLRALPVQDRSNKRLTALLDAAATLIHRHGFEELTTAAVAKEAGASIGTVYRYFEDRVSLLKALATRNYERTSVTVAAALAAARPLTPSAAVPVVFETYLSLFRTEVGYRSLRTGDVLDIRPDESIPGTRRTVDALLTNFEAHYDFTRTEKIASTLEIGIVSIDALLARAFRNSTTGEEEFIAPARAVAATAALDIAQ